MTAEERGKRTALSELRRSMLKELQACCDNLSNEVSYFGPKGDGTCREHGRRTLGAIQATINHFEAIIPAAFRMDNMQDLVQEKVRKRQVRGARNRVNRLRLLENKLRKVLNKTVRKEN